MQRIFMILNSEYFVKFIEEHQIILSQVVDRNKLDVNATKTINVMLQILKMIVNI